MSKEERNKNILKKVKDNMKKNIGRRKSEFALVEDEELKLKVVKSKKNLNIKDSKNE